MPARSLPVAAERRHLRSRRGYPGNRFSLLLVVTLLPASFLAACGRKAADEGVAPGASTEPSRPAAVEIIDGALAALESENSSMRIRAMVHDEGKPPVEVTFALYRRKTPENHENILLQIITPDTERDRSILLSIGPDGSVEGTRYVQANNSFVTLRSATIEDSLFGMSLQELADGQLYKYDFKLVGEEVKGGEPAYRLDGDLKPDTESKFPRIMALISKETSGILRAEFYSRSELVRTVDVQAFRTINDHLARSHWSVENMPRNKRVDFELIEATYGEVPQTRFTTENLKRAASR